MTTLFSQGQSLPLFQNQNQNRAENRSNTPNTDDDGGNSSRPSRRQVFGLVDANQFYCSCEKAFRPDLANRPVVVLSNNDGCIVALTPSVKALGIKRGTPYFQCAKLLREHGTAIFSSNYTLYGSLSKKMMLCLEQYSANVEAYSIDEAFLSVPQPPPQRGQQLAYSIPRDFDLAGDGNGEEETELTRLGRTIQADVKRWTFGVPVSVTWATTKTLAKAAMEFAKKQPGLDGVFDITGYSPTKLDNLLERVEVKDVWGIGGQRAALLRENGIENALQLKNASDAWVLKHLTVMGLRTVHELRGISCLPLELVPPDKKAICCAKSFGRPIETLSELGEALATYVSNVAQKLRKQGSHCRMLQVFVRSSGQFREDVPHYSNAITLRLPEPTAYTPVLVAYARYALARLYKEGFAYQKVGIILLDITPETARQLPLPFEQAVYGGSNAGGGGYYNGFGDRGNNVGANGDINLVAANGGSSSDTLLENYNRQVRVMAAMDDINHKWGRNTVRVATSGVAPKKEAEEYISGRGAAGEGWQMRRARLSPCFTTRWEDILTVAC